MVWLTCRNQLLKAANGGVEAVNQGFDHGEAGRHMQPELPKLVWNNPDPPTFGGAIRGSPDRKDPRVRSRVLYVKPSRDGHRCLKRLTSRSAAKGERREPVVRCSVKFAVPSDRQ